MKLNIVTPQGMVGFEPHPTNEQHIDGLCPDCWLPAMWRVEFVTLTAGGVTTVPLIWTGCLDCPDPGRIEQT